MMNRLHYTIAELLAFGLDLVYSLSKSALAGLLTALAIIMISFALPSTLTADDDKKNLEIKRTQPAEGTTTIPNTGSVDPGESQLWAANGAIRLIANHDGLLKIYNLTGTVVANVHYHAEQNVRLPLPKGLYFATLSNGKVSKISITDQQP
jgi:hypothetical protein